MAVANNCVLSIAGFDPCGGAGILADIKTFEAHRLCGMGAVSVLTYQNDIFFEALRWIEVDEIVKQISVLKKRFQIQFIKIGLIKDMETLETILSFCTQTFPSCKIVWDPVIKASAGFEFHTQFEREQLLRVIRDCYVITPNTEEVCFLTGVDDPMEAARQLSQSCSILLKGGHNKQEPGVDFLFHQNTVDRIHPYIYELSPKHGSGCVLSSAICSNLALGHDLLTACQNAKKYVEGFLASNSTLLGSHHVC